MKFFFAAAFALLAFVVKGDIKKETLRSHKNYRKIHGVGRLKWGADEAAWAQKWCDHMAATGEWKHSEGSGYGENLYQYSSWSQGQESTASTDGAGTKAVKSWYDEIKDYNFNSPGFSSGTGHFTQVSLPELEILAVFGNSVTYRL